MMCLRGPGSRNVSLKLHESDPVGISVRLGESEVFARAVRRYGHLGTIVTLVRGSSADSDHKAGVAFAALKTYVKPVQDQSSPFQGRVNLALSLVQSRMLHNIGGTHIPSKEARAPLQRVLWRTYEALARKFRIVPGERKSCNSLAEEYDLPLLSSFVSAHRVRLLLRQADCGFTAFYGLWQGLRHVPGSWPDLVLSDLCWLRSRDSKLS